MSWNVAIALNPRANGLIDKVPSRVASQIQAAFEAAGHRVVFTVARDSFSDSLEALRGRDDWDVLAAGGGDGSVLAAANLCIEKGAALALLPLGTLNLLARDLRLPANITRATKALAGGGIDWADVGTVNGRRFLTNFTLGVPIPLLELREQVRGADILDWPRLGFDFAQALSDAKPIRFRVDSTDGSYEFRSLFLMVTNNPFIRSSTLLTTRESLNSGFFGLYAQPRKGWLRIAMSLLRVSIGGLEDDRILDKPMNSFTLHTVPEEIEVTLDGEFISMQSPLDFEMRQRELKLVYPKRGV